MDQPASAPRDAVSGMSLPVRRDYLPGGSVSAPESSGAGVVFAADSESVFYFPDWTWT